MQKLKKWFINLSIQRKLLYCTVGISLILILSASLSLYIAAARIVTTQTRKQSKWFINLSIQRKLLYCTVGISLILILSASLSLYIAAARIVTTQTRKQSAGVIEELSVNLDHYFQLVENSFDYIANNNVVQEELESDEPYRSDGTERYSYYSRAGQIRRLLLQGYTSVYMKDIQLYGYNGANHLLSNERQEKEVIEETVCSMAEEANGSCVYYYDREEDKDVIYIAKQIKDALTMEPLGILRASILLRQRRR